MLPEPLKSIYLDEQMFVDPAFADEEYVLYSFKYGLSQEQKDALLLISLLKEPSGREEEAPVDRPEHAAVSLVIEGMGDLAEKAHPLLGKKFVDQSLRINADDLITRTKLNRGNDDGLPGSPIVRLRDQLCSYFELIKEDQEKLRAFLIYATGAPVVPPNGIKVNVIGGDMISAHSCFSSIDIPSVLLGQEEIFNSTMDIVIEDDGGGFNAM
eukprot:COSAG01_NODE_61_length_29729_cov_196.711779_4_plen_212_part_00